MDAGGCEGFPAVNQACIVSSIATLRHCMFFLGVDMRLTGFFLSECAGSGWDPHRDFGFLLLRPPLCDHQPTWKVGDVGVLLCAVSMHVDCYLHCGRSSGADSGCVCGSCKRRPCATKLSPYPLRYKHCWEGETILYCMSTLASSSSE